MTNKVMAATLSVAATIVSISVCTEVAAAPVQPGQYNVSAVVATTGAPWNAFGVCVKSDNSWYMTSQVTGSGRWLKHGNNFLWHGNMGTNNDSGVLRQTPGGMMGHSSQWIDYSQNPANTDNLFYISTWAFQSPTCLPAF